MDRWLWDVYENGETLECPICERWWRLSHSQTPKDMRHCPWCGERLDPPKEES